MLDVGLEDKYTNTEPENVSLNLNSFKNSTALNMSLNYCSSVGKLNYLAQTVRLDIIYAAHQICQVLIWPKQGLLWRS